MPKKHSRFSYLLLYYADWAVAILFLRIAQFIGLAFISIAYRLIRLIKLYPSIQSEIIVELIFLRWELMLWRMAARLNKTISIEKQHGGLSLKSKLHIIAFVHIWKIPKCHINLYLNISRASYQRYITQLHYGLTALTPKSKRPFYSHNITCQSITKLVWRIKETNPHYGRIKTAMAVWQNGAYIHPTTVDKILTRPKPNLGPAKRAKPKPVGGDLRTIPAYYPNHIWGIDLTTIYPFGLAGKLLGITPYYVLGVEDYYSRKILWLSKHRNEPSSRWIIKELKKVFRKYGKPKHIISDQGAQFTPPQRGKSGVPEAERSGTASEFTTFIKGNGIKQRYGKVGSALSNGRIERGFKSLKYEFLNYYFVLNDAKLDWLLKEYLVFYNNYRPHMAIDGQLPSERYKGIIIHPPPKTAKRLNPNIRKVSFASGMLNGFVSNKVA